MPSVHPIIRIGFPVVLAAVCLIGFAAQMHYRGRRMSPRRARRVIVEAAWVSGTMGAMCSSWTVVNWLAAPPENHSYYAMIMAMGSLATAYCLSSTRFAALLNLGIGMVPIADLMLTSGHAPEIAAGTSLVVATMFLVRMILQQHGQLVDLLELQRQMRDLADFAGLGIVMMDLASELGDPDVAAVVYGNVVGPDIIGDDFFDAVA